MKAHDHMKFPDSEVNISVKGDELLVILDCLLNVHSMLIKQITAAKLTEAEKKKAYDFAYDTEVVYDNIMKKLGLYRSEREDLN